MIERIIIDTSLLPSVVNHCHDPEITDTAVHSGITDTATLNRICSWGERPYAGTDDIYEDIQAVKRQRKKGNLPKSALPRRIKQLIIAKFTTELNPE